MIKNQEIIHYNKFSRGKIHIKENTEINWIFDFKIKNYSYTLINKINNIKIIFNNQNNFAFNFKNQGIYFLTNDNNTDMKQIIYVKVKIIKIENIIKNFKKSFFENKKLILNININFSNYFLKKINLIGKQYYCFEKLINDFNNITTIKKIKLNKNIIFNDTDQLYYLKIKNFNN